MKNKIQKLLISLGISSPDSIKVFYPRVRDRDDIKVLRCNKSGVIFLSEVDHVKEYYRNSNDLSYWSANSRKEALQSCYEDDFRRARQFGSLIENKKWLDFGTGAGGILDLLAPKAAFVCAIEPQAEIRRELQDSNYIVFEDIDLVKEKAFDVITLFHVFEHLSDPIGVLEKMRDRLSQNGILVIEVPHAKDFLINFLDLESFKAFTFWSEHLILHTRGSLEIFLRNAGFSNISIAPFQRYPLANHLYWLQKGKPGGHKEWAFLVNPEIDGAYFKMLSNLDMTDTLIATASK